MAWSHITTVLWLGWTCLGRYLPCCSKFWKLLLRCADCWSKPGGLAPSFPLMEGISILPPGSKSLPSKQQLVTATKNTWTYHHYAGNLVIAPSPKWFGTSDLPFDNLKTPPLAEKNSVISTLWFWGFWGSLTPHLIRKYIIPGSTSLPPLSKGRYIAFLRFFPLQRDPKVPILPSPPIGSSPTSRSPRYLRRAISLMWSMASRRSSSLLNSNWRPPGAATQHFEMKGNCRHMKQSPTFTKKKTQTKVNS